MDKMKCEKEQSKNFIVNGQMIQHFEGKEEEDEKEKEKYENTVI